MKFLLLLFRLRIQPPPNLKRYTYEGFEHWNNAPQDVSDSGFSNYRSLIDEICAIFQIL